MVDIGGGGGQQHEDPFREAGSRQAMRAANLSQLVTMIAYLRSWLPKSQNGDPGADRAREIEDDASRGRTRAEWNLFRSRDLPHVYREMWGGPSPDGGWRPGANLDAAYEAWLSAARMANRDPRGAAAVMEVCRQRMAACPGGTRLLLRYTHYLHDGLDKVEAMRRAWDDTAAARSAGEPARARPHGTAEEHSRLNAAPAVAENLPAVASGQSRDRSAGRRVRPDSRTAAVEAAHLLGAPEVTLPYLHQFQTRYGNAVARDAATLARQWLADAYRRGFIDQDQHDAWRQVVDETRRSPEHAQWRIEQGLDPAPAATVAAATGEATLDAGTQRREDHNPATAAHLAGHAGQHHRTVDRKLGRAVDDPHTPHVDEQDVWRQRAHTERGVAELYDAQSHGIQARSAAARPSPAALRRAAPPADLARKHPAPIVASQLARPRTPGR